MLVENDVAEHSSAFLLVDGVSFEFFRTGVLAGTSVCAVISKEGVLSSTSSGGSSKMSGCACTMAGMSVALGVCVMDGEGGSEEKKRRKEGEQRKRVATF